MLLRHLNKIQYEYNILIDDYVHDFKKGKKDSQIT